MSEFLSTQAAAGSRHPGTRSETGLSRPLAVVLAIAVTSWLTLLFVRPEYLDQTILQAIYVGHNRYLKALARLIGHFGAPEAVMMLTICAGALLASWGQYLRAPIPLIATLFAHAAAALQRDAIGRTRPDGLVGVPELTNWSFPPTRVVDSLTAYLVIALLLTKGARVNRIILAGAVLIGGSNGIVRVTLGHHWPSDTLVGWSFGTAVAIAWYWLATFLPAGERT